MKEFEDALVHAIESLKGSHDTWRITQYNRRFAVEHRLNGVIVDTTITNADAPAGICLTLLTGFVRINVPLGFCQKIRLYYAVKAWRKLEAKRRNHERWEEIAVALRRELKERQ